MISNLNAVETFLSDFTVKSTIWKIIYVDTQVRNANTLLSLDISPVKRRELVDALVPADYIGGPADHPWYGSASTWSFGKNFKQQQLTISIALGCPTSELICIAFHPATEPLHYPYRTP